MMTPMIVMIARTTIWREKDSPHPHQMMSTDSQIMSTDDNEDDEY